MNTTVRQTLTAVVPILSFVFAVGCQDQQPGDGLMATHPSPVSLTSANRNLDGTDGPQGKVHAALKLAQQSDRYLYVFLTKSKDQSTARMREVFQEYLEGVKHHADGVEVSVTATSEKGFIDLYGLNRAPMPLVLAFAPNGAVTGGFPTDFTADDLASGMVGPVTADCIKSLQDGQLVVLCIQNDNTTDNVAARTGAEEFANDPKYRATTRVVVLDPANEAESSFLAELDISPATSTAVTVLLAPPGSPIAKFAGATSKAALVKAVSKASSSCCPGGSCGPNGCPPQ